MKDLLDRLGKRLWVSWLACMAIGVAAVAFGRAGYDSIALVFNLAVPVAIMTVCFDYGIWHSRAREALGAPTPGNISYPRDWRLLTLMLLSMLSMTAVYAFDLPHDLIVPFAGSIIIPSFLKSRSALVTRLISPQHAR